MFSSKTEMDCLHELCRAAVCEVLYLREYEMKIVRTEIHGDGNVWNTAHRQE